MSTVAQVAEYARERMLDALRAGTPAGQIDAIQRAIEACDVLRHATAGAEEVFSFPPTSSEDDT